MDDLNLLFNSYFKSWKHGILQNTSLDRSIDRDRSLRSKGCKPSMILFCDLENFYASGTQDVEVTKCLKLMEKMYSVHFPMVLLLEKRKCFKYNIDLLP